MVLFGLGVAVKFNKIYHIHDISLIRIFNFQF